VADSSEVCVDIPPSAIEWYLHVNDPSMHDFLIRFAETGGTPDVGGLSDVPAK
jgi:hypothetical protein